MNRFINLRQKEWQYFISDEIPEIIANCNRVIVLKEGECSCILEEEDLKEDVEKKLANLIGQSMKAQKG